MTSFAPRILAILLISMALTGCGETQDLDESLLQARQLGLQDATCVTFQRGTHGNVADASISSHQPRNPAGNLPVATVGVSGQHARQLLLRFDLGELPPTASVRSATLKLWQKTPGEGSVRAHRITRPWDEATVTWEGFASAFSPTVAGTLRPGAPGPRTLELTGLTAAWVRDGASNQGVLLELPEGATQLDTSESPQAERRPRLEVCYLLPDATPQGTSLLLSVLDAQGQPLFAAVTPTGGEMLPTDGAGRLLLENLPPGRFVARVEALGHAPASVSVKLTPGNRGGAEVRLLPLGPPTPFQAEQGVALQQDAVRVEIPPAALVDGDGRPVTGTVNLTVTPLDPTQGMATLPGPLEGVTTSGGTVDLESAFMAEVSMESDGRFVQLAPGARATLQFTLPPAVAAHYQPGDTIPAWWFDHEQGIWVEEGVGDVRASPTTPGRLVWVVKVGHFTWWNADAPITDKSCVAVRVLDTNGDAVPNVQVLAVGVDYAGHSAGGYTGPDGRGCVDIKRGGTADIFIGSLNSVPRARVTGDVAATCGGGGCKPLELSIPPQACTPGQSIICPYSGDPTRLGRGVCKAGRQFCNTTGSGWSICQGEVLPSTELCASPFDENCDGRANENCPCGSITACYTGPQGTEGVGRCRTGTVTCTTTLPLRINGCGGELRLPLPETCNTPEDDDCNGSSVCQDIHVWSQRFGDTRCQEGLGIATDGASNVIISGVYAGTVNFGGGTLASNGGNDVFVAKFDANGNHLWSQSLGNVSYAISLDVATDPTGNVLVSGVFYGDLRLNGTPLLTSNGNSDSFVVKFSPNGTLIWSQRFGGPSWDETWGMDVDSNGDVLLAGRYWASMPVNGTPLTSAGDADAFIVKMSGTNGALLWGRSWGGTGHDRSLGVAVDGARNVWVTGGFQGTAHFGGAPSTSQGDTDFFLVKLDKDGNHLWNRTYGGVGVQLGADADADSAGNVWVTGGFTGTFSLGGPTLTSAGDWDIFLAKFNATGAPQWSKSSGGPGSDIGEAVAVNATGSAVVITGGAVGPLDFVEDPNAPNDLRVGNGGMDVFVAKFDTDGGHRWSQIYGDGADQLGFDIDFDTSDNVVLIGDLEGQVNVGGTAPLQSAGCYDILLMKLRATP